MFGINNGSSEPCNFCSSKHYQGSYYTGKGKLVCEDCAEDLIICECCGEYREEEEFLYGQETCDSCLDKKADLLQDGE
jgi:hypothetical protein